MQRGTTKRRQRSVLRLLTCVAYLMISMALRAEGDWQCAMLPDDDLWHSPEYVQRELESLGYRIENLSMTLGNCYELTGMNGEGDRVLAIIDPVTRMVLDERVVD